MDKVLPFTKMKVIIATGIFPPDIGGPAIYVEKLARELKNKGVNVKVITYSDNGVNLKHQRDYNFPVVRISRNYSLPIRYFLYFWNLLFLARNAEVIYAQCPIGSGLPGMLVSKILNRRFVLKITSDYAWDQYCRSNKTLLKFPSLEEFQKKKFDLITEIRRKIQKITANNANKIIVPSYYLKKIACEWGIKEDKIRVIYNAVENLHCLAVSKEKAKEKINVKGDILLSIGRLVLWKGFSTLIDMMPDLLKENPNFRLTIIGDGPERKKLELQIRNHKLQDKIFLMGNIKHSELPLFFRAADLFILNTAYEGLSHVILEAMKMEVPVITTNVCGNPELIQNNYNGILVEYDNKEQLKESILKLWKDKNLQQKFIKNSLQELKKFSFKNMINQTLSVLKY